MVVVVGLFLCAALFVVSLIGQPQGSPVRTRRKK